MYFEIPSTSVRLLGSLHMVPAGQEGVPDWAREAYAWSEALVVEHDPPTFLPFFKSPIELRAQIPGEIYDALTRFWPAEGPLSPLNQLRPWAALMGVALLSVDATEGIEPRFLRWLSTDPKPVSYLEEAQHVAKSLDAVDQADIVRALALALQDRNVLQERLVQMHEAWIRHDRSRLLDIASTAPLFALPNLRKAALENRNRAWIPRIEALLGSERRTLIVIGALHLCGPQNVEQLLGRELLAVRTDG